MASISAISLEMLRLMDPLSNRDKKSELKNARANPDAFQRQVDKIMKLAEGYRPICFVGKAIYCDAGLKINHKMNCPHSHSLAAYYAFNRIINPSFKTEICRENHSSDSVCPQIHEGDLIYLSDSGRYMAYIPKNERKNSQKQDKAFIQNSEGPDLVTLSQEGYPTLVQGLGLVFVPFSRFQSRTGDQDNSPQSSITSIAISPPSSAAVSPILSPNLKSWSPWNETHFDNILPLEKPL